MPKLSQRALGLQESAIRKLDLVVARQKDASFYRLNIGQPDIPTPQPILDVIHGWPARIVAYGPASGTPASREAAAAYMRRWCPSLRAEHVAVTSGGSEALLFAFTAICDPGDEILVPEPYYTNYNGFATVAGATVRPIRTRLEDAFAIPPDDVLDGLVTPRTRAIVLNTPGNPTGVVYSRDEMRRVVAWARRHDLFVVSDEVYRRIWFDAPPTSALELDDAADAVIVVDSTSKAWSACGLRIGWLVSRNEAFMEKVERLGQARLGPQPLGQEAAMAALALPESYYEDMRRTWKRRVDAMFGALAEHLPDAAAPRPQGAFYAMVGLPGLDDSDRFARFLVTEFRDRGESVVVAPGTGFYADPADGRSQFRLAAVRDEAAITRSIEILAKAWAAYRAL